MERKYAAFISYRHADLDSAVAKTLHSLIEQYRIPKSLRKNGEKKLGIVFRDEEELSATNDLTDKIYTALDNSEHLVVICTKSTLKSPWVTREVEHFLKNHERDKAHIILADGEPMEVFPQPLTHKELEDGTSEVIEPMAVDARAENIPAVKKKLKSQIFRLFAAMLGCPYDSLAMREQRRKRHRFAAVMSVILAIAVGFSAVLLVKNHQIDRKNAELDSANSALEAKNQELDRKNAELEEKNAEVLLRESELLTANSEEYYLEGDNYSAIYNAAMALPTEDDPRPYYAPAEAALLTALGPFSHEDRYIIESTVLEQTTPVENFRISADGKKLATMDMYSVVTFFDTVSGEILGSVQLNLDTVYYSSYAVHMYSYPKDNSVIVFDGTTVASVSFDTYEVNWTYKVPHGANDFFEISSDGEKVACVNISPNSPDYSIVYEFILLSNSTGEVIKTIPFAFGQDYGSIYFTGSLADGAYNGRFSSDDSIFITTYFTEGNTRSNYTLHYVSLDLIEGTCREICSFIVDDYYFYSETYLIYFYDDESIISIRDSGATGLELVAERISVKTGKILWQTFLPTISQTTLSSTSDNFFGFYTNTTNFIILNDCMYSFYSENGEFISASSLGSVVAKADIVNGSVVYVDENGHYSAAFLDKNGISDYGDSLSLGGISRMRLWNNGPDVLHGSSDKISEDSGYIAITPTSNPCSVIVKRVAAIQDILPGGFGAMNDGESYLSSAYIQRLTDSRLAIGPYSRDGVYLYKIIDAKTGELITELSTTNYLFADDITILPDASGFVECDPITDARFYSADGEYVTLTEMNYAFYTINGSTFMDISSLNASVVLSETNEVLIANCSDTTLTTWINGTNKKEIPIPEEISCFRLSESGIVFFFKAAANGNVIIPDFDDEDLYVDRFAVYSTVKDTWSFIENKDIVFLDGLICYSDNSSDLLILDDNSNFYMYSPEGELMHSFHLNLPINSVFQMTLILDNEYLFVKTSDLQVNIYDIQAGELIYSENNVSTTQVPLSVFADRENNRLYVTSPSTSYSAEGLCIDMGTWTTIARIGGLIYFNEDTSELYRIATNDETYRSEIYVQKIPPAKELAALAREYLGI